MFFFSWIGLGSLAEITNLENVANIPQAQPKASKEACLFRSVYNKTLFSCHYIDWSSKQSPLKTTTIVSSKEAKTGYSFYHAVKLYKAV